MTMKRPSPQSHRSRASGVRTWLRDRSLLGSRVPDSGSSSRVSGVRDRRSRGSGVEAAPRSRERRLGSGVASASRARCSRSARGVPSRERRLAFGVASRSRMGRSADAADCLWSDLFPSVTSRLRVLVPGVPTISAAGRSCSASRVVGNSRQVVKRRTAGIARTKSTWLAIDSW